MSLSFVIPPGSEVMLVRASERTPIWKQQVGRIFRVRYYSEQDGFGTIWLVNEDGDYEQSIEPRDLRLRQVQVVSKRLVAPPQLAFGSQVTGINGLHPRPKTPHSRAAPALVVTRLKRYEPKPAVTFVPL